MTGRARRRRPAARTPLRRTSATRNAVADRRRSAARSRSRRVPCVSRDDPRSATAASTPAGSRRRRGRTAAQRTAIVGLRRSLERCLQRGPGRDDEWRPRSGCPGTIADLGGREGSRSCPRDLDGEHGASSESAPADGRHCRHDRGDRLVGRAERGRVRMSRSGATPAASPGRPGCRPSPPGMRQDRRRAGGSRRDGRPVLEHGARGRGTPARPLRRRRCASRRESGHVPAVPRLDPVIGADAGPRGARTGRDRGWP